jgi:aminoglycoside 6'-N-acetyltransferase
VRVPDAPLEGELTVLRPVLPDEVDLLVAWHADPEVSRYWDDETFTHEEIVDRLSRPDVDAYVVTEDGEPVGYLQVWFDADTAENGGLDMFLIPDARGRGLGPDAARTIAEWLLDNAALQRVTVDPYLSNGRAIAAWTKAGFDPVEEHGPDEEHVGPWLLMSFVPRGREGS